VRFRPVLSGFPIYTASCKFKASEAWMIHAGKRFVGAVGTSVHVADPSATIIERLERPETYPSTYPGRAIPAIEVGSRRRAAAGFFRKQDSYSIRLEQVLAYLRKNVERMHYCVVHGDLNLRNVIVSEETGALWLIDFARTRQSIPALDYITFEMAIRSKVLSPIIARLALVGPAQVEEKWALEVSEFAKTFEELTQSEARLDRGLIERLRAFHADERDVLRFKQGWQTILDVRQIAFQKFYRGASRVVYDAVTMLLAMRAMQKYDDDLLSDCGPTATLWAAAAFEVAYGQADRWVEKTAAEATTLVDLPLPVELLRQTEHRGTA
jgi:hypothetical protein